MGLLLDFEPRELDFPFEVNKKLVSSILLTNKTGNHVAFKLLTTQSRKYGVQPRIGILPPGASCVITVTMKALSGPPTTIRCKDKFMIQSVVTRPGRSTQDAQNLFNQEASHLIQECKLNVVFSFPLAQLPPVPIHCTAESSLAITPEMDDQLAETPNEKTNVEKLLEVRPSELQFPLKWVKDFSHSFQLSNTTENRVAFMVKAVNPKYFVQPSSGIILPQSVCYVTARLLEQNQVTSDMKCKDKFLIQSILASSPITTEDIIIQDLFDKVGPVFEELEVRVVYMLEEKKSIQAIKLIKKGVTIILMVLASWYLMKPSLSLIWSLIVAITMLMMKMIKKLVSEWLEDWIVKALLCIIMPLVFKWTETLRIPYESLWPY